MRPPAGPAPEPQSKKLSSSNFASAGTDVRAPKELKSKACSGSSAPSRSPAGCVRFARRFLGGALAFMETRLHM
eukprot:3095954-Pyramimonas_sp.AAC.1